MLPVTALAGEQEDGSPAPDTSEFEEILPVEPEADPALNVSIVGEEISGRSKYAKEIFSPTASTWRPSRDRLSTKIIYLTEYLSLHTTLCRDFVRTFESIKERL